MAPSDEVPILKMEPETITYLGGSIGLILGMWRQIHTKGAALSCRCGVCASKLRQGTDEGVFYMVGESSMKVPEFAHTKCFEARSTVVDGRVEGSVEDLKFPKPKPLASVDKRKQAVEEEVVKTAISRAQHFRSTWLEQREHVTAAEVMPFDEIPF